MGELIPDHDQRPVARRDMRVSDDERRSVVDELRTHFGAGRLDLAEFEDRTNAALVARVRGELEPLLDDLPELAPPHGGPPVRPRPQKPAGPGAAALRIHTYIWLVLSAFFVVLYAGIAAVADGGGGSFWPIFPIAGIGLTVGVHAAVRRGLDR